MHSNWNRNRKSFVQRPHLLGPKRSYIVVISFIDQQDDAVGGTTIELFVGKPDFYVLFVYIVFDGLRLSLTNKFNLIFMNDIVFFTIRQKKKYKN